MAERRETVKQKGARSVKVDKNVKLNRIDATKNEVFKCSCCGKEYASQRGNFLASKSILFQGNNGYITICRECAERYYLQLIGYYSGNEEHALERCCQLFDWYYNADISEMVKGKMSLNSATALAQYVSKMNMVNFKNKGTTYLDTVKDRAESEKVIDVEDVKQVQEEDGDKQVENVSVDTIKFFGYGYTGDEYEYLEEQYGGWCGRHGCKTKAQEEIYKNLCIAQVNVQRAQKRGSIKDVNDAIKTFQDLLGAANIKPNQANDNALADQNTFGTLIKKWENERPISEPAKEWQDVDKIHEYIDTYFLGHLCNLVHIKNDCEEAYRREMEKHTVKPPIYEADELNGGTALLDKFSNKGDINNDIPE